MTVQTLARWPRGFTLIEIALCVVIVGVAFVASMELFVTCSRQNSDSLRMSCAASLAGSIRELITRKSFVDPMEGFTQFGAGSDETDVTLYDDIDDFHGKTFNPPIDAVDPGNPQEQADLAAFSQRVTVQPVDQADFSNSVSTTSSYSAVRVTVDILYARNESEPPASIYSLAWVECRR